MKNDNVDNTNNVEATELYFKGDNYNPSDREVSSDEYVGCKNQNTRIPENERNTCKGYQPEGMGMYDGGIFYDGGSDWIPWILKDNEGQCNDYETCNSR